MSLSAAGLGTGMDINAMVNKIVESERAPKQERILESMQDIETDISAYGRLKNGFNTMRDLMYQLRRENAFNSLTASSSLPDNLIAQAEPFAVPGVYAVEVQQLAQPQKIVSPPLDKKANFGNGSLNISLGRDRMTLELPETEVALIDLVRSINGSPENPGIRASVINDDQGTRLMLGSDQTGAENTMTVTVEATLESPLQSLGYDKNLPTSSMSELQAAMDAQILLDGLSSISSPTNRFDDAVRGVSFEALKVTTPETGPALVTVAEDRQKARAAIEEFVSAYNSFFQMTQSLASYDPETQEGGPLVGDTVVRSAMNQLRSLLTSPVENANGAFSTFSELGVATTLDGYLEIDQGLLNRQINQNFSNLDNFFSGTEGFSRRIETLVRQYTGADGAIRNRENTLNEQKLRLNDDQNKLDERMAALEKRTMRQFSSMDSSVSEMQSQLSAMMNILPG